MRWWLLTIAPSSDIAALLRSVGFPWGNLAAAQPQVTDEGIVIAHYLLGKVTCFPPHPSVLPLVELPPAAASTSALGGKSQAVWLFLSPRAPKGRLLVGRFP